MRSFTMYSYRANTIHLLAAIAISDYFRYGNQYGVQEASVTVSQNDGNAGRAVLSPHQYLTYQADYFTSENLF